MSKRLLSTLADFINKFTSLFSSLEGGLKGAISMIFTHSAGDCRLKKE